MPTSPTNKELLKEQESVIARIKLILQGAYLHILKSGEVAKAIQDQNENFSSQKNKSLKRKIDNLLKSTGNEINISVINGIDSVWDSSDRDFWENLKHDFPTGDKAEFEELKKIRDKAIENQREVVKSAKDYLNEKRGNYSISDRIWNATKGIPTEIDALVQNAIRQGLSADDLSGMLRKHLKEPERLYRKVLNKKTGKMEPSKAAQDYHPGRGVYRSSYKNAVRLARTEINHAYRYAEWLKYQENPMILGFEIRSSRQENTCPVCRDLEGIYPKSFKWTGWHPQCMCVMLPVQISREEFVRRTKLKMQGRLHEYIPTPPIREFPENFKLWIEENSERIENALSLPWWYAENLEMIRG